MLKRLKITAQCAMQNVRRSFTFHFNNKHKLDFTEVKSDPNKYHILMCDCGEEFTYLPYSDYGEDNVGVIVDRYNSVWQYVRH